MRSAAFDNDGKGEDMAQVDAAAHLEVVTDKIEEESGVDPEAASVKKLISQVSELAVLPHVVFKVLELSSSTDNSTAEIEQAITVDPGFSSKCLILANSAAYALPRKVTSIREALMFLGYKQIRSMAMTVGVFDIFVGKNDRESLRRRAWWRHSVDTAVCCRWIAETTRMIPPDDAYTCGLLHYIGKTLLDRLGGKDYKHVEDMILFGIKDYKAEEAVYGCNHMQVAIAAVKKWGLADSLTTGLDYAHAPDPEEPDRGFRACTAIATQVARMAMEGLTTAKDEDNHLLPLWAMEALAIPLDKAGWLIEGGCAAISAGKVAI